MGLETVIMRGNDKQHKTNVERNWEKHIHSPLTLMFIHPHVSSCILSIALLEKNRQVIQLIRLALAPTPAKGLEE